jgi:hypothetical protein
MIGITILAGPMLQLRHAAGRISCRARNRS